MRGRAGSSASASRAEQPAGVRPRRPGARLHPRELGAAGHGVRAADALPRPAAARRATGSCPRSRPRPRRSRPTAGRTPSSSGAASASATAARSAPTPSRRRSTARSHRASTLPPTSTPRRSSAPTTSGPASAAEPPASIARGHTLTVRFTREVRDFAAWTTMPFFCAVPPDAAAQRGGRAPFPGAGPYAIDEYRPDQRIVHPPQPLLRRPTRPPRRRLRRRPQRRLTRGSARPHRSRQGRLGVRAAQNTSSPAAHLIGKYGINDSRYFVMPGLSVEHVRSQLVAAALQGQPASYAAP